jgi:hypothetical protein
MLYLLLFEKKKKKGRGEKWPGCFSNGTALIAVLPEISLAA